MRLKSKTPKWVIFIGLLFLIIVFFIVYYNNKKTESKYITASSVIKTLPPDFKNTLLSMYDNQPQMGSDGKMYKIDISTSILPEQGMCIFNLCKKVKPKMTLEIGFAYGFSTVFFLAGIKSNNIGSHVVMDPFELTDWHGIGLKKVEELKMDSFFRFLPEFDFNGLPNLAKENLRFDVIFVDGDHRFDFVLMDFTLSDYVIANNGYIIFHDIWMPSIKKVVEFIKKNRSDYQVYEEIPSPQMIIFKKISSDKRQWDYFNSF